MGKCSYGKLDMVLKCLNTHTTGNPYSARMNLAPRVTLVRLVILMIKDMFKACMSVCLPEFVTKLNYGQIFRVGKRKH